MASQKPLIDGYSPSAWKSLVVKSLRIGWPEGLRQASLRLSPSMMKHLLLVGVFEDTFPPEAELEACRDEIKHGDFVGLCGRDTHHGRGYTDAFCDLEEAACKADPKAMFSQARRLKLYLPDRAWNLFYTWLAIQPKDAGSMRQVDRAPWRGMPLAVLDMHTSEGWKRFAGAGTLLSGTYEGHRALGEMVQRSGWQSVWDEVHAVKATDRKEKKKQPTAAEKAIARHQRKQDKKGGGA